jgi:CBS domain-containing protein
MLFSCVPDLFYPEKGLWKGFFGLDKQRGDGIMARRIISRVEGNVVTIDENKTALDAAVLMTEKFIGSVIVTSSSKVKGIFTERDLMMRVVGEMKDPAKVKLKEIMSKDFVKARPTDTSKRCLDLMKEHRCRHLLVYDDGEFLGIVSLRDLVSLMIDEKEDLIKQLEDYIKGY